MNQNDHQNDDSTTALTCPICLDVMKDPVVEKQLGHSYDKGCLIQWLRVNPYVDPKTNFRLAEKIQYTVNHNLRQILMETYGDDAFVDFDNTASGMVWAIESADNATDVESALKRLENNFSERGDADLAISIAEANGIDIILKVMNTYEGHSQIQGHACGSLFQLLSLREDNRADIFQGDGIDRILRSMREHSSHASVQGYACGILGVLDWWTSGSEKKREAIVRGNGIGLIRVAMRTHPMDDFVQLHACWAIAELAMNGGYSQVIAEDGGIDLIFLTLLHHWNVVALQQPALGTLCNLAVDHENCIAIGRRGGIGLILSAMRVHRDNNRVQECACLALKVLAPHHRDAILRGGGVEVLRATKDRHPNLHEVVDECLGYL